MDLGQDRTEVTYVLIYTDHAESTLESIAIILFNEHCWVLGRGYIELYWEILRQTPF